MASRILVANELLAFVQYQLEVAEETILLQTCISHFSEQEINNARIVLYQSLHIQQMFKALDCKDTLLDIMRILKQTNRAYMPVFVAKDLGKLPVITFDQNSVGNLLNDIAILKRNLAAMQLKIEAQNGVTDHPQNLSNGTKNTVKSSTELKKFDWSAETEAFDEKAHEYSVNTGAQPKVNKMTYSDSTVLNTSDTTYSVKPAITVTSSKVSIPSSVRTSLSIDSVKLKPLGNSSAISNTPSSVPTVTPTEVSPKRNLVNTSNDVHRTNESNFKLVYPTISEIVNQAFVNRGQLFKQTDTLTSNLAPSSSILPAVQQDKPTKKRNKRAKSSIQYEIVEVPLLSQGPVTRMTQQAAVKQSEVQSKQPKLMPPALKQQPARTYSPSESSSEKIGPAPKTKRHIPSTIMHLSWLKHSTRAEDIIDYIHSKTNWTMQVEKLKSNKNTSFKSFLVKVPNFHVQAFLKETFWPVDTVCRYYKGEIPDSMKDLPPVPKEQNKKEKITVETKLPEKIVEVKSTKALDQSKENSTNKTEIEHKKLPKRDRNKK